MGRASETLLGKIPVIVRSGLGSEHLSLLLTSSRIIVVHVGKRGAGSVATTSFFGKLSGAIEDLFKSRRESLGHRRLESLSPSEILDSDKDSFFILYDEVVSVTVTEMPHLTWITILTKDAKLDFFTSLEFSGVVGLLEAKLASKLTTKGLGG